MKQILPRTGTNFLTVFVILNYSKVNSSQDYNIRKHIVERKCHDKGNALISKFIIIKTIFLEFWFYISNHNPFLIPLQLYKLRIGLFLLKYYQNRFICFLLKVKH